MNGTCFQDPIGFIKFSISPEFVPRLMDKDLLHKIFVSLREIKQELYAENFQVKTYVKTYLPTLKPRTWRERLVTWPPAVKGFAVNSDLKLSIRDLKQPRRRAEWTLTGSVLTKPATSAHVSDVVHMAFRTWHLLICRPQVNVSIQSNLWRFCAHFTLFNTNVWKKETVFVLFVEGWAVDGRISRDFR